MGDIPRVFHFIWLGSDLPEHLEAYIWTWRNRHPSWVFNVWRDEDMPVLFNQAVWDAAPEIVPGSEWQLRCDLARYEILAEYGGVYVDCDFECRMAIDDLLRKVECFAAWEVSGKWVNNAILGATPRHPVLVDLVEGIPERVRERGPHDRPNRITGPQYITQYAGRMTVFPKDWFYPYAHNELDRIDEDFPDAYAVHHWHNQRRLHAA